MAMIDESGIRRLNLQARSALHDLKVAVEELQSVAEDVDDGKRRLRGIWRLNIIGHEPPEMIVKEVAKTVYQQEERRDRLYGLTADCQSLICNVLAASLRIARYGLANDSLAARSYARRKLTWLIEAMAPLPRTFRVPAAASLLAAFDELLDGYSVSAKTSGFHRLLESIKDRL